MESERRTRKNEIISHIRANNSSLPSRNIVSFVKILLQEARESLDDAGPQEVPKIQGEIRAYKTLIDMITKDVSINSGEATPDLT